MHSDTSELMGLSDADINAYRSKGYITPRWRLPDSVLHELSDLADALIASNPGVRPEQLVCPHIEGGSGRPLAGDLHDRFLAVAHTPELVGMVSQLIGPNVILWGSQLFAKRPRDGMEIPWHQDGHYWPIKPLATCSAWIAVDRADRDNGCMRVIPGSHRNGLFRHQTNESAGLALDQALESSALDQESAADIVLEPGQVSLHDVYLVHSSQANYSPRRRAGMVFRYMPAEALYDRGVPDRIQGDGHVVSYSKRPLYFVAGNDPGRNRCHPSQRDN